MNVFGALTTELVRGQLRGAQPSHLCCPQCGAARVLTSQTIHRAGGIVRRRRCENGHYFTTLEEVCDNRLYLDWDKARKARRRSDRVT